MYKDIEVILTLFPKDSEMLIWNKGTSDFVSLTSVCRVDLGIEKDTSLPVARVSCSDGTQLTFNISGGKNE